LEGEKQKIVRGGDDYYYLFNLFSFFFYSFIIFIKKRMSVSADYNRINNWGKEEGGKGGRIGYRYYVWLF